MATLRELGEWGLIQALTDRFSDMPPGWIGIGDDTAVGLLTPGRQVLTTVDMLVEAVHFRRRTTSPFDLGWKSLAVNLSDIAGMGGEPRWAVLALSLPGELEADWVFAFYDGLAALAAQSGLRIVGGDTVGSPGPIAISITVVGETERPILRKGAEPGDVLFVTGPVGASAAGLWCIENPDRVEASSLDRGYINAVTSAHRRPIPQLTAGLAIQRQNFRMALLDNSDSLARSAALLAEANGVDVRLAVAKLPIDAATRAVAAFAEVEPLQWALFGGEDYNLVGALAPADFEVLTKALAHAQIPCHAVGDVLPGSGRLWVRRPDQQVQQLDHIAGFEHFGGPDDR